MAQNHKVKVEKKPDGSIIKTLTTEYVIELTPEKAQKRLEQMDRVEKQMLAKLDNLREQRRLLLEALK